MSTDPTTIAAIRAAARTQEDYCVPGHPDEETDAVGPWLRLDTFDRDWHPVVLDETAATTLRDQLTEWLDAEKVHPR